MENIQKSKVCTKCKIPKNIGEFNKRSALKDGYRTECKKCQAEYNGAYYQTEDGKKSHNKSNKKYINTESGRKRVNENRRLYEKNRRKIDFLFKMKHRMRCDINEIFKKNGYKKTTKTAKILGCSFEEFKSHIESLWKPWMNWENYGKHNGEFNFGWDFDHIIPLSYAETEDELIKLCHFSNIQPLCSHINRDIKKDNLSFTIDTLSYNLVA
jgi:hypothetical protein